LTVTKLFLLLALCLSAPSQADSFYAPVAVTATTTSTLAMAKNNMRGYLIIVNTGSVTVYAKFGSAHSATEGIPIPAGGSYEPIQAPVNSVYLVTASSTSAVTLLQGNN
jgi:hypothetical protein